MALTNGLQLPFGIQPVNPVPVDSYSGPYEGHTLAAALTAANNSIPQAIRFKSLEVRLVVDNGAPLKYWYKDGVANENLAPFSIDRYDNVSTKVEGASANWDNSYLQAQEALTTVQTGSADWNTSYLQAQEALTNVRSNSAYWVEPTRRFDFIQDSPELDTTTTYTGVALLGTLPTLSGWRVQKIVYTNIGAVSSNQVCQNGIWTDRYTLTYTNI